MKIKLFYSYSHKDSEYKKEIEKTLSLLKKTEPLIEWYDRDIIPGQSISNSLKRELDNSNIYLFLLSRDFISSESCLEEWEYVKNNIAIYKYRIPVIVRNCTWVDFLGIDDVKVLPDDGKPITSFKNIDRAYTQIYEGIKQVIESYKKSFLLKKNFLTEFEKTGFISQDEIKIRDIFIFPKLSLYNNLNNLNSIFIDIKNEKDLLKNKFIIINGEEGSGKTTLCKYLFLSYVEKETPVLFVDLGDIQTKKAKNELFIKIYEEQFEGDYNLWFKQENKTIIFDNLSSAKNSLEHVELASNFFDNVIVATSTDQYQSFFKDDERLIKFSEIRIEELSHHKQEELIKKRLSLIDQGITKEKVDHLEDKVNSVLHNNILPRYPFYILSILQSLETFMPNDDITISSYGHCYRVLIVSHLIKSGINKEDSSINSCFNFLEKLAFELYESKNFSFDEFKKKFQKKYLVKNTLINRLSKGPYALINNDGQIKEDYIYYYFLGFYFAKHIEYEKNNLEKIMEQNYLKKNSLILLFIIHHTTDYHLIEDMLISSMCIFDTTPKATLNDAESSIMDKMLDAIPKKVLSSNSVEKERSMERNRRDSAELANKENQEYDENVAEINDVYRIFKTNELLSQILRSHYGNLEQRQIKEIIETIIDSGLRLIKLLLDKKEVEKAVKYIHKKKPNIKLEKVRIYCQTMCFLWVVINIEKIVDSIKVKEIQTLVRDIAKEESTPVYDLIRYCSRLGSVNSFSKDEKKYFDKLHKKYKGNKIIQETISLKTQMYLNTHDVKADIKQSICSTLGIEQNSFKNIKK